MKWMLCVFTLVLALTATHAKPDPSRLDDLLNKIQDAKKKACSIPVCYQGCPYGSHPDKNGCPTCNCKEPPRDKSDETEENSALEEILSELLEDKKPCRQLKCAECPHGNKKDKNGCPTCDCLPPPPKEQSDPVCPLCRNFCPYGRRRLDNGCLSCTCIWRGDPTGDAQACRQLKCAECQHGNKKDKNGCPTCDCLSPPKKQSDPLFVDCPLCRNYFKCQIPECDHGCPNGFKPDKNGCPSCHCYEEPRPKKKSDETEHESPLEEILSELIEDAKKPCRMLKCAEGPHGNRKDKNGCRTCEWLPAPKAMSDEEEEYLEDVFDEIMLDKKPKEESDAYIPRLPHCPPLCKNLCPFGRKLDMNGCPTCTCLPSTKGKGDALGKDCQVPKCDHGCPYGFKPDKNGCPSCHCKDPPKQKSDETEYQSELEEVLSEVLEDRRPCAMPRCLIACEYGYKKDQYGCQIACQCNPPPPTHEECYNACLLKCYIPGVGEGMDLPTGCSECHCI